MNLFILVSLIVYNVQAQEKITLSVPVINGTGTTTTIRSTEGTRFTASTTVKTSTISTTTTIKEKGAISTKTTKLVCPGKEIPRPFFALPCSKTSECKVLGRGLICCSGRCLKGINPPKPEPTHEPAWFGLVERKCPVDPIPEFFEIKKCQSDFECSPRICCFEQFPDGQKQGFCRTAEPVWDKIPPVKRFMQPLSTIVSYMQCTPPPPPVLDLFPKPCNNPLDCFPNLCCQEKGKRYCRPPKRSILALVAGLGQRLVPEAAARNFIERIS